MSVSIVPVKRGESRVWVIPWRVGPANAPEYVGHMVAGAHSKSYGELTAHRIPSDDAYGQWDTIAQTKGAGDNPTATLQARSAYQIALMERLGDIGCPLDVQIHFGPCEDPQDFNRGWQIIRALEAANITSFSQDQLGAMEPGDEALILDETPVTATESYPIKRLAFAGLAGTVVQNEVIAIFVCDSVSCGECANPSEGDERVIAVQLASGGSPGILAEVAYSADAGGTWAGRVISTLAVNEEPDDATCVGGNLVVVSEDSISLHYLAVADVMANTGTWTEVATGFVAAGAPRAMWSNSSRETYIVGLAGYIYRAEDPTAGVTVLDAGVATTQALNDVHAASSNVIVAVGASNAVVKSIDGGTIWSLVVGPTVGVALNTVWCRTEKEWWVGTQGGELWYTLDQGVTWTEKLFSGTATGVSRDIIFATDTVGYFAHSSATPTGRILRTVDGGYSWYVLPESTGSIPTNTRINVLAVPWGAPPIIAANQVYGGGLTSATDGIIVKAV